MRAKPRKHKKAPLIKAGTIALFFVVLISSSIVMTTARFLLEDAATATIGQVDEGKTIKEDMEPISVDVSSPFYSAFTSEGRYINILLLGLAEKNTDTIMLCCYDTTLQKVDIISVPRDTFYYRESMVDRAYYYHKINAVYRTEGIIGTATAVSKILYGVPIHYYAIVEYKDIAKILDVIGGVYMDIGFHMKYDDPTADPPLHIDIPKGHTLINGDNVEGFLRFRKGVYGGYPTGDIGRIATQQTFIKEAIKKCLKLSNILDVVKTATSNIECDVTYAAAAKLATSAAGGLSADSITSYTLPGTNITEHNLSFWNPDDGKIFEMLSDIFLSDPDETGDEGAASAE